MPLNLVEETVQVEPEHIGKRVDQVAAELFPDYSRARLQGWIKSGELTLNGNQVKTKDKVPPMATLELKAELEQEGVVTPQNIALDVIYDDEDIIVIDKPADLVVHPGAGQPDGTLQNAILFHYPETANLPRSGIVHRLDKDTTGVMVVARSARAYSSLVEQLQTRDMGREYDAIVQGLPTGGGTIDEPIGRHATQRTKMAVSPYGKPAISHYTVLQRFRAHTHVRVKLETGRTHQIRVHMTYIHHPLIGDTVYSARQRLPAGISFDLQQAIQSFSRQALHARKLRLIHPGTGEPMEFSAPMPEDMQALIIALKEDLHV
ncbi:23S rRNA pseudouridine(1911/1915/1917) synthase RluD [Salinibius halmophilus]|uniref:23S rRNA pseudouridine(1911/1915/1917) synthase RluD n=1 Tax=Salinibius halmophilus TaxID=1853216 RepID=UPI000E67630E|nr:23S rRNA pseudouridine(1911/1915/1917) synthase RluD [Salinibius halmophilus]